MVNMSTADMGRRFARAVGTVKTLSAIARRDGRRAKAKIYKSTDIERQISGPMNQAPNLATYQLIMLSICQPTNKMQLPIYRPIDIKIYQSTNLSLYQST